MKGEYREATLVCQGNIGKRTNEICWDEATLWRSYTMLTDVEAVFRSLKSELGLRPIFHSKEERAAGHLLITVLAYQAVQVLR